MRRGSVVLILAVPRVNQKASGNAPPSPGAQPRAHDDLGGGVRSGREAQQGGIDTHFPLRHGRIAETNNYSPV